MRIHMYIVANIMDNQGFIQDFFIREEHPPFVGGEGECGIGNLQCIHKA